MNSDRIEFLRKLRIHGQKENIPNVSEVVGKYLYFMVKAKKSQKILEIGMANGLSTIYLASGAEINNGQVVCYEISEPGWIAAEKNFQEVGLSDRIEIRKYNVLRKPPESSEKFDFIFIDGQKAHYHEFWELAKKHITPDGIIIFDDVLKFAKKTEKFHEAMKQESDWDSLILPIEEDDGIMIVQKKN